MAEDEGQASNSDNVYQPAAANVTGEATISKDRSLVYIPAMLML